MNNSILISSTQCIDTSEVITQLLFLFGVVMGVAVTAIMNLATFPVKESLLVTSWHERGERTLCELSELYPVSHSSLNTYLVNHRRTRRSTFNNIPNNNKFIMSFVLLFFRCRPINRLSWDKCLAGGRGRWLTGRGGPTGNTTTGPPPNHPSKWITLPQLNFRRGRVKVKQRLMFYSESENVWGTNLSRIFVREKWHLRTCQLDVTGRNRGRVI